MKWTIILCNDKIWNLKVGFEVCQLECKNFSALCPVENIDTDNDICRNINIINNTIHIYKIQMVYVLYVCIYIYPKNS